MNIEGRIGEVYVGDGSWQWPEAESDLAPALLTEALQLAAAHDSDSLLVIHRGALVAEQYWNGKTSADVQQTYSGTKSVFSLLVGRSIERGYIEGLDQCVRDLVPEMPEAQARVTFHNVLAMQSGMENSMQIEGLGQTGMTQLEIGLAREIIAAPFTRYHYNNAPYRMLFTALERAADRSLETLTREEVFEPLGFDGAYWVRIYAVDESERFAGYQSIRMTPRDFAKSAQVISDHGRWDGENYLPAGYVDALVIAPAPDVNPSFGLFHHLNAGDFYRDFAIPDRIDRKLMPGAPDDAFLMFGSGGQVTIGVPSRQLVIVRTGEARGSIYDADNYIARLIATICAAASS